MSTNIPSTIFYGSTFSALLSIARCTPRASDLFSRMMAQGGNRETLPKELKKALHRYLTVFQKFGKTQEEINISKMKSYKNLKQYS